MDTVTELCKKFGIELQPPDGQPFHCGQRMDVRSGIVGPDYAECKICGLAIGNIASPHISGIIFQINDEIRAERTWTRLDTPPIEQPGASHKEQPCKL